MTGAKSNRRALAKAATREKLLDAARFLFANAGYFGVGIRDVADRMAMSTGAVFAQVKTKAELWTLALGGPAPDEALAEEVALIQAQRPGWRWLLRFNGEAYLASITAPDWRPFTDAETDVYAVQAATPAEALHQLRIAVERGDRYLGAGRTAA